jgi:hypothetical protein
MTWMKRGKRHTRLAFAFVREDHREHAFPTQDTRARTEQLAYNTSSLSRPITEDGLHDDTRSLGQHGARLRNGASPGSGSISTYCICAPRISKSISSTSNGGGDSAMPGVGPADPLVARLPVLRHTSA